MVRLGQHLVQLIGRVDALDAARRLSRMAPRANDAHADGVGAPGQRLPDIAQADHRQRLTAKLVDGQSLAPVPFVARLCPHQLRQSAREAEHHAEQILRHVGRMHAAVVGQDQVALDQLGEEDAVDARAAGREPAQLRMIAHQVGVESPADQRLCTVHHLGQLARSVQTTTSTSG